MQNRVWTLILVVIVGVSLGVSLAVKKVNDSLLLRISKQQDKILKGQNSMAQKFSLEVDQEANAQMPPNTPDWNQFFRRQQDLETRLTALETQLKNIQNRPEAASNLQPLSPPPEDYTKIYDIAPDHSFVKGPKNASVTVVEFLDFQCPFCARYHPFLAEALKGYSSQVRYMVKNFPLSFHPQARPAAKAAFAAGKQGKYWDMVDALLENGRNLNEENFKKSAKDLGLDADRFWKDYKERDEEWENYINEDLRLARKADVRGTPTFFINGRKTKARDAESFKKEIEDALNVAK